MENLPSTVNSAIDVRRQVNLIQEVMQDVMKKGEHYDVIPGCKKPSLFKPGAEKLLLTFRLAPDYEELSVTENEEIISYRIKCVLRHITTGDIVGSGNGACNSREKKYYTRSVSVNKATDNEAENSLRMEQRDWNGKKYDVYIIKNDPWELQNTIYKMAAKRALIAAVLNATAASDIFSQDIEDIETHIDDGEPKPEPKKPQRKSETQNIKTVSQAQISRLMVIADKAGWSDETIANYIGAEFGLGSKKELDYKQYDILCNYIIKNPVNAESE